LHVNPRRLLFDRKKKLLFKFGSSVLLTKCGQFGVWSILATAILAFKLFRPNEITVKTIKP
jgi:hypothetical protein